MQIPCYSYHGAVCTVAIILIWGSSASRLLGYRSAILGLAQSFLNRCQQFEHIERLTHRGKAPTLELRTRIVCGNEEYRCMPRSRILAYSVVDLKAICAGKLIIENEKVNGLFGEETDGITPVMQNEWSRIRLFPQRVRNEGRDVFVVLNN